MNDKKQSQLERRVRELEVLYEIGKTLASTLDLQEVLGLILRKALEITKSDYGTLGMLSKDRTKLIYEVVIPEGVETPPQRVGQGITGMVAERKAPILVSDVRADPVYMEAFPNMRSELAVPLILQDELIGVLNVESPRINAFDENHRRLLEALADLAAIAVQNAERLDQRVRELETLRHIDETISSVLDLDRVLNLILSEGVDLVRGRHKDAEIHGMIQLIDKAVGDLVIRADIGVPEGKRRERARIGERGITGLVAEMKKSLLIRDVQKGRWKNWYVEMIPGVRSELAVPLLLGKRERLIGIFNLESPAVGIFDEDDERLIKSLSRQAVIAIWNAEQYETVRATYEIGKVISSSLAIDEVLGVLLDKGIERVGAHLGSARLLDEESGELVPRVRRGPKGTRGKLAWRSMRVGDGIVGAAAKEKKTIRVADVRKDSRYQRSLEDTASELAIPILSPQENLIGVLNFEHPLIDAFSEDDVQFIELLSEQAAIAIQNASEHQELEQAYADLEHSKRREIAQASWATLGQAAIGLAHRVDNIAAFIKAECRELVYRETLDEPIIRVLRTIAQRANSITEIFTHLLFPFKESEGLPTESLSVNQVIREALQKEPVPDDIELTCELDPGLPPVEETALLVEVICELLTNAKKAIRAARSRVLARGQIHIGTRFSSPSVMVSITNSGRIIPAGEWEAVFNLFYRKGRGSAMSRRLPFGLWWVKTYLQRRGGSIQVVRSNRTEGTTFEILLLARS